MVIPFFDWHTANAYWCGYFTAISDAVVGDFNTWGLNYVGAFDSNLDPVQELRRRHFRPTDGTGDPSFDRRRATEIAGLICDVVEAYVEAHRE